MMVTQSGVLSHTASAVVLVCLALAAVASGRVILPPDYYTRTVSRQDVRADAAASAQALKRQARAVRVFVRGAVRADPDLAAELVRLAFHDAYTVNAETGEGGCNGSIRRELGRGANRGLDRPLRALAPVQAETGLGWGDVIAVAGAEAVESSGGPRISLRLGRDEKDSPDPAGILPGPLSSLEDLRDSFGSRGFSDADLIALSGAHTLGAAFGSQFVSEPTKFQNDYFKNLEWFIKQREDGLSTEGGPPDKPNTQLPSDMALITDSSARDIVARYAASESEFFKDFTTAYRKLTDSGFRD